MTAEQRTDLSDDISVVTKALEKAKYIWADIDERFFAKDPSTKEGCYEIMYSFARCAAFSDILGDLLNEIGANLPSEKWIDNLSVEDEKAS